MANASYGGLGTKNFADNTQVGGGTAGVGRTFLGAYPSNRLLQNGTITSISYLAHAALPNGMRFCVWRPNGSNFDLVARSAVFTPVAGSTQTRVLATPITGVQPGDLLGYWIDGDPTINVGAITTGGGGTNTIKFTAGDASGTNVTFGSGLDNLDLPLEAFGVAPIAGMSGDSIEGGHGTNYSTYLDTSPPGPQGDISSELGFCMRTSIGSWFTYQDYSKGSQTWAWVRATSMPAMISGTGVHQSNGLLNQEYWFHCGVNDIAGGRTWANVLADLDAIYALAGTTPMFVNEIIPDTNFNDTLAAVIRTFNTNYAAWAVGKMTVRIVPCWAALGVLRVSTGLNDNLNPTYDCGDGVHPNAAGAAVIASQRASARQSYYGGIGGPGLPVPVFITDFTAGSIEKTYASIG